MKYIKSHKDFAKHINKALYLNIPEEELEKIDEAFQNDVTLSNSLIGQLFGWIFRKIGARIKKGQMNALLEELANEFGKGQYSAVRHKKIAKKNAVYSTIVGLKNLVNDDSIDDDKFEKKFSKELDNALEEYRELIEGKGDVKIEDPELMKVAKEFYAKLNKLSDNPVDLKPELTEEDEAGENVEAEAKLNANSLDESLKPNIKLFDMLVFSGDSKLDVIATNLEHQLPGKDIIVGHNLIRIKESNLSFDDIDKYFKALNMSVELINDSIIIENYDRYGMLFEEKNEQPFLVGLQDFITYIMTRNIKLPKGSSTLGSVGMKTEKDFEEKGEGVYNALKKIYEEGTLNNDIEQANKLGHSKLSKLLKSASMSLSDLMETQSDSTGFRSAFSKFKSSLLSARELISTEIEKNPTKYFNDEKEESGGDSEHKTVVDNVELGSDNKGRLELNDKHFNKLGNAGTKVAWTKSDGTEGRGKINPNQPKDIDEEIGLINVILDNGGTSAIDGDKITKIIGSDGKEQEINGILNRGHKKARERRKTEQSEWEKNVDILSWYLDKEIEYEKNGNIKKAHVLPKEEQLKDKGTVGGLKVRGPNNSTFFLDNIEDVVKVADDVEIDPEHKLANRSLVKSMIDSLFTDDKLYERELILNERDKKDLLNDIKHKANNNETLINPLQVLKIFNKAHHKYTVEDYSSIPDGSQGSTLQGKGKGVNKKKNYKKMPDGSGRQVTLFKQWNEGVIDLLESYGEYIPDKLKKFIISVLNDNTIFGNGGAQAKLLQDYFNIKVNMDDVLSDNTGRGTTDKNKASKADIYIDTKDTIGVFGKSKSGSLQMKKENFNKVPFIMKGEIENVGETALVCYYMGAMNDNILFKYKENNIYFLNNYKREEQIIKDQKFVGIAGDEVKYGLMKTPKGANKDLKEGDIITIWSSDVNLEEEVERFNFKISGLYYLKGENDGGVMRLDTKRPKSEYDDIQQEDIKKAWQKFTNK